jgi:hypothetical protein
VRARLQARRKNIGSREGGNSDFRARDRYTRKGHIGGHQVAAHSLDTLPPRPLTLENGRSALHARFEVLRTRVLRSACAAQWSATRASGLERNKPPRPV